MQISSLLKRFQKTLSKKFGSVHKFVRSSFEIMPILVPVSNFGEKIVGGILQYTFLQTLNAYAQKTKHFQIFCQN
jgi:hypothetical protein